MQCVNLLGSVRTDAVKGFAILDRLEDILSFLAQEPESFRNQLIHGAPI